jgi:Bacteriocin (Lactococcin_972)
MAVVAAGAAPAFASIDSTDCNWLGLNCRGTWDHGINGSYAWSFYKQQDLTHGSSVFGNTASGLRKSDSQCASAANWSNAQISNVTNSRTAYWRDHC